MSDLVKNGFAVNRLVRYVAAHDNIMCIKYNYVFLDDVFIAIPSPARTPAANVKSDEAKDGSKENFLDTFLLFPSFSNEETVLSPTENE
mmetsp:Transcript_7340/g.10676  ORF Transcript_7340/g.10676 Transcript_7340/m.10676 type:complete len:89 (+) Transcript_7340:2103-2369(+)